jgi:hypothetical protein
MDFFAINRMRFIILLTLLLWLRPAGTLAQGTIRYIPLTTPNPHYPLDSQALRIYSPITLVSYDLDFDGDGSPEYTFQSSTANGFLVLSRNGNKLSRYPLDELAPLASGTVVGPTVGSIPWASGLAPISGYDTAGAYGYFIGLDSAYAGLQFNLQDGTHYGWARISVPTWRDGYWDPFDPNGGWLYGYAWETRPDTPIMAGAVPEPAIWALLVAGSLLVWSYFQSERRSP